MATVAAALLVASAQAGAAYVLAPQWDASTQAYSGGVNAEFYRVDNQWQGSTVLWNESTRSFGSGEAIGTFGWGTGLWGQADWWTVQASAAGNAGAGAPALLQTWQGRVDSIAHANSRYNECYAATWGSAALLPFFSPVPAQGDCNNPEAGDPSQQNWTARYSGYIRITEAGLYNFSVLHDDGFFFDLFGAEGAQLGIGRDYLNPRERVGFAEDLWLSAGLYGFELGVWNRLGAGVVDLRWARGCTAECEWALVPADHLVGTGAVPEPSAFALACAALLAAAAGVRRRRPRLPTAAG